MPASNGDEEDVDGDDVDDDDGDDDDDDDNNDDGDDNEEEDPSKNFLPASNCLELESSSCLVKSSPFI